MFERHPGFYAARLRGNTEAGYGRPSPDMHSARRRGGNTTRETHPLSMSLSRSDHESAQIPICDRGTPLPTGCSGTGLARSG